MQNVIKKLVITIKRLNNLKNTPMIMGYLIILMKYDTGIKKDFANIFRKLRMSRLTAKARSLFRSSEFMNTSDSFCVLSGYCISISVWKKENLRSLCRSASFLAESLPQDIRKQSLLSSLLTRWQKRSTPIRCWITGLKFFLLPTIMFQKHKNWFRPQISRFSFHLPEPKRAEQVTWSSCSTVRRH